jgi:hypothetical protein
MRPFAILLGAALALAAGGQAGAVVVIDFDTTIDYEINEEVEIIEGTNPTPPTVVGVAAGGGFADAVRVYDSSILNMPSGYASMIYAYDTSTVTLASGWTSVLETYGAAEANVEAGCNDIFAYGTSTVNLLDGAMGEIWSAEENSTLNFYAGDVEYLHVNDSGKLNVFGGKASFTARDSGTVNVIGGDGHGVDAYDASKVSISGGVIQGIVAGWTSETHTCVVTIEGSGFNYPYGAIADASGTLTGTLADGTAIDCPFETHGGASIVLVPEPAALSLLALGALAMLRRRRKGDRLLF